MVLKLLGRIRTFPRVLEGVEVGKGLGEAKRVGKKATSGRPPGGGLGKSRKYFKGKTDVRLRDWEFSPKMVDFWASASQCAPR